MDYNTLIDLATDLGYELAMNGAETFRVEESISRVLASYGIKSDVFAIPNYLVVSITGSNGQPITRMRRIGQHGNNLDGVEKFSSLSRALCNRTPDPKDGLKWLEITRSQQVTYSKKVQYLGYFLGAFGFALFFGGNGIDGLCAGLCGILIGMLDRLLAANNTNFFFRTIAEAFSMAFVAYCLGIAGISPNTDATVIGALMILVPGLLFTNAMRDIIYGDTNSGINRIVQVLLIAVAIALGTAAAWNLHTHIWGSPVSLDPIRYTTAPECFFALIGCVGFAIVFNIHGPGGLLCALGGMIAWFVYRMVMTWGGTELTAYFFAALTASLYSEIMARIRKYPAISYLVVSIFPLIPGAGVYYTMRYAVDGKMDQFANQGMYTAAIAGIIAVGILLGSTFFRIYSNKKTKRTTTV